MFYLKGSSEMGSTRWSTVSTVGSQCWWCKRLGSVSHWRTSCYRCCMWGDLGWSFVLWYPWCSIRYLNYPSNSQEWLTIRCWLPSRSRRYCSWLGRIGLGWCSVLLRPTRVNWYSSSLVGLTLWWWMRLIAYQNYLITLDPPTSYSTNWYNKTLLTWH